MYDHYRPATVVCIEKPCINGRTATFEEVRPRRDDPEIQDGTTHPVFAATRPCAGDSLVLRQRKAQSSNWHAFHTRLCPAPADQYSAWSCISVSVARFELKDAPSCKNCQTLRRLGKSIVDTTPSAIILRSRHSENHIHGFVTLTATYTVARHSTLVEAFLKTALLC